MSEADITLRATRLMSIYRTGQRDATLTIDDYREAARWRLIIMCADSDMRDEEAYEHIATTRLN